MPQRIPSKRLKFRGFVSSAGEKSARWEIFPTRPHCWKRSRSAPNSEHDYGGMQLALTATHMTGSPRHLLWIPATALVGFTTAFVLADLLLLPVDVYYFFYFASVIGFVSCYAKRTQLDVPMWVSRRIVRGMVFGLGIGLVLARGVLAQPETAKLGGAFFWCAIFWRGMVYGFIDGVLLMSLPWTIVWRALDAERRGTRHRIAATLVAWIAVLFVTTAYHLGYSDFRSTKILQPNIGSTIGSLAVIVAANPLASQLRTCSFMSQQSFTARTLTCICRHTG